KHGNRPSMDAARGGTPTPLTCAKHFPLVEGERKQGDNSMFTLDQVHSVINILPATQQAIL
ncbi:hypothetical protein, partial [Sutterella wadsworthensis]|uniref:hypothetical protein n=1 Tax=Sutterella wadsworthensis TaxID=40545 RepID=UPI00267135D4